MQMDHEDSNSLFSLTICVTHNHSNILVRGVQLTIITRLFPKVTKETESRIILSAFFHDAAAHH
jgi:hypothetical protein